MANPFARPNYITPTVAVIKFENRAPLDRGWDLGGGMKDVLVDRLLATERFRVVERHDLQAVLGELQFQNQGPTRKQGRAKPNRLKNVQYLVKGVVNDFGHVESGQGAAAFPGWDIFGGGRRAQISILLQVVDVESGEVLASENVTGSVRAHELTAKADYDKIAFGGSRFYRTPLGKATSQVIDKAVKRIAGVIARRPWRPKIAAVNTSQTVVINGGSKQGIRAGSVYQVFAAGQPIVDPDTGDVIGHEGGRHVGDVQVRKVRELYCVAEILTGKESEFKVGHLCRPMASTASAVP